MTRPRLLPSPLHPITVESTGTRVVTEIAGHLAFYPDRADISVCDPE